MRAVILSFILLTAAAFMAPESYAQSKKELAAQNAVMAARIDRLEARLLTGDPAAEALMARMDSIEAANRNLTGEIERLRFERDNLRAEVKALAEDIREQQELSTKFKIHLDAVELVAQQGGAVQSYAPRVYGGGDVAGSPADYVDPNQPAAIAGPPTTRELPLNLPPNSTAGNDISGLPDQGKAKLAEGDFSTAQTLFQQYLTLSPDAPDAGEVSFWLGETFFVKGGYADAADAYIASMRKDRDGAKAPEAMIKLGASLRELGNKAQACQTLDSFTAQYPGASEALRNRRQVEITRTGC